VKTIKIVFYSTVFSVAWLLKYWMFLAASSIEEVPILPIPIIVSFSDTRAASYLRIMELRADGHFWRSVQMLEFQRLRSKLRFHLRLS
jgi:hypothetical protein